MLVPYCTNCARPILSHLQPLSQAWPCLGCGKMLRHRQRHHCAETFCSDACEDAVYARREKRHERERRRLEGIHCVSCGVLFRPTRRGDAATCSPACRQRMYRKRVTDKNASREVT
jgi:hypothetical protein